ncbi:MAG: hypothetical protein BBJ60_09355 [Desulfobacterales bacterium S7086C20]|nr:MAG: hypothetical protein BBJ60_09355 [Desulfobacterales bacterium S7086C20]
MKTRVSFILLLILLVGVSVEASDNFVTVYNDDLALIKQVRTIDIERQDELFRFTDVAAKLIPSSVRLRSVSGNTAFRVIEQNFEYDLVSSEKILEKYIDHPIEIIRENGELIRGVLLNKQRGSLVLRTDNGIKLLPWNDETTISVGDLPEGLITRPTLVWALAGVKGDKEKVEVSYLTTGMDWQAQYVGVLDAKSNSIGLDAWVSVNNRCGTTFKDAKLKLVAGEVHRALAPESRRREKGVYQMQAEAVADRGFKEREFFEYHIYDLGRRTTVKNNQIKQIALFPPATVSTEKGFFFNAAHDAKKVEVRLTFLNKENAGLGKPLPAGVFRIYKKDQASLEFVGEDRIDHTPCGEEIKITVGKAFDLRGERKVVKSRKISDRSERRTIEIELRNNKEDEDVKIVVEETLYYKDWDIEEANFPHTKKDMNHVEFQVPVKAQGKAVVRYRLLRRW